MDEYSEFHTAVIKNRVSAVKRFLNAGEPPDSLACALAIEHKAQRVLKLLIRSGLDVNKVVTHWGYTPLVWALKENNLAAFRILAKAGAVVDKSGRFRAPLHYAAVEGLLEGARLCIAAGAKLEQHDCSGNTPLMLAASMGRLAVVKLLLKAGANPLALNAAGRTPCQLAEENDEPKVVELLAPVSQRKPPVKRGVAALIEAVKKQDMRTVEKCLAKGIDVNGRDRFRVSPMDEAIEVGSVPLAKRLIEAGVDLNKVGPDGMSFLEAALRAERREIVNAGALTNPPGNKYPDAHYMACAMGDLELLKLLLSKGANPKHSGALISAARKKSIELMNVLIKAGAEVNETNEAGETPLFWAVFRPLVKHTTKTFPSGSTLLSVEDAPEDHQQGQTIEAVGFLIEHGVDVNHTEGTGRTALTYANSPEVVKLLLKSGARLDVRDKQGHDVKYWLRQNGIAKKDWGRIMRG